MINWFNCLYPVSIKDDANNFQPKLNRLLSLLIENSNLGCQPTTNHKAIVETQVLEICCKTMAQISKLLYAQ